MDKPPFRRGIVIGLVILLVGGCAAPAPSTSSDADRRRENAEKQKWLDDMLEKGQHSGGM